MAISTTEQLSIYLKGSQISFSSLEQLSGGSANYVWRLTLTPEDSSDNDSSTKSTLIIKHAEPYVAANPSIPFPVQRMDFEAQVLRALPQVLSSDSPVGIPSVNSYDPTHHVLTMTDGGPRTLKAAYSDPSVDIPLLGEQLGAWLATLHQTTSMHHDIIGDNIAAKTIYRYAYTQLSTVASEFEFDVSLGDTINQEYGSLLQTDKECLCHGDFWPGNILLNETDGIQHPVVIDWEMTRYGCGATDVGQFAAEAYLLDRSRGGRGLCDAFLKGYKAAAGGSLNQAFRKRVTVHLGVHLAFWPARVSWGTEKETREMIGVGQGILRKAVEEEWKWLEHGILREIF
ncbi:MAG: hypothetical protein M1812_001112 [Candelaria pacifica]|nr:MAG: hypothetical protein M1812_001112 [Candelaria pacifica]